MIKAAETPPHKRKENKMRERSIFFLVVIIVLKGLPNCFVMTNHKPTKLIAKGISIKNKVVLEGNEPKS